MSREAIGVDIGGTHLRAARVAPDGRILARALRPSSADPETVLTQVLGLVGAVGGPQVAAIGVGVPGQVRRGRVLSGGYVDLSSVDLAGAIGAATGLPVTLDNDGNMALAGEAAFGAARGLGSAVLLTIGTGIGGGILDGGRVLHGAGVAGQLGHVVVVPGGRACVCGRRGCVETESSGTALGRHVAEAGLGIGTGAEALLAGGAREAAVLEAWVAPLRAAIETLAAALNPDAVILGGGLGGAAVKALARRPFAASWFAASVVAAALGADAGLVGAAVSALPAPKRAILVNGVPASGKSTVARALGQALGAPVLALDTVKAPFLAALGPADRAFNRRLGLASYDAMFALLAEAPARSTTILDAWFGFAAPEILADGLARAGVTETVELWCEAAPDVIGARYGARSRPEGHPGAEYVPELVALAARAAPTGQGRLRRVDTTQPLDVQALAGWVGIT